MSVGVSRDRQCFSSAYGWRSTERLGLPMGRCVTWLVLAAIGLASELRAQGTASQVELSADWGRIANVPLDDLPGGYRWYGDQDQWLLYHTDSGRERRQYWLVATDSGRISEAWDNQRLGGELQRAGHSLTDHWTRRLSDVVYVPDSHHFEFHYEAVRFRWLPDPGQLEVVEGADVPGQTTGLSPLDWLGVSRGGGNESEIVFWNQTERPLSLHWVNPAGQWISYGRVDAGERRVQHTFQGHRWVLAGPGGQPRAAFEAAASSELAIVAEQTPAPRVEAGRQRQAERSGGRPQARTARDGQARNQPVAVERFEAPVSGGAIRIESHNVWLERDGQPELALSDGGTEKDGYVGPIWWSPDGNWGVVRRRLAGEPHRLHLIESSPPDQLQPRLETLTYAKPGDIIDRDFPELIDVRAGRLIPIERDLFDEPYENSTPQWRADSTAFRFVHNARGHQRLRVIEVPVATAAPRVVVDESSETFIDYAHKQFLHWLDQTQELIWMSERDGWNHLYLIDQASGHVKQPITRGEWVVRGVERVDSDARQLWVRIGGFYPDQDPYQVHLARVNFDGSDLTLLTDGDGTHRWEWSPTGRFLIATFSRVDLPPVVQLRDARFGRLITHLAEADSQRRLAAGWRPPERFVAMGRDGQTPIYGLIVWPPEMESERLYPVLEYIYAGPQSAHVPKEFGAHQRLGEVAALGFVVVQIDGMGTSHRSKAFHDHCWRNLQDAGFPDRRAWITAAAEQYPQMDLSRVGIWGGSAGGQNALAALLHHGDFYHAAVADCGCHDNRMDKIWWNELWMGWPVGEHYEASSNVTHAAALTGDLLLIVGELDRNVDPASTLQVAAALIRANKDFELLLVPGAGHGAGGLPYGWRRTKEFFVRSLYGRPSQ
jgi:dipeptidyl-peptidase 4